MYKYGQSENVSLENFKGLVKFAAEINAYDSEIVLLEDSKGERSLVLSSVESLEKDGTLDDQELSVVWSETVSECIDNLSKGYVPEELGE